MWKPPHQGRVLNSHAIRNPCARQEMRGGGAEGSNVHVPAARALTPPHTDTPRLRKSSPSPGRRHRPSVPSTDPHPTRATLWGVRASRTRGHAAVDRTHPKRERAACATRPVCKLIPPPERLRTSKGIATHTHSTYIAGGRNAQSQWPIAPAHRELFGRRHDGRRV